MSVLKLLQKKNLQEQDMDDSDKSSQPEDDSEGEEEVEESAFKEPDQKQWKNRARVLITSGRGSAPGFRQIIKDVIDLLPHCKKEVILLCLIFIVSNQ